MKKHFQVRYFPHGSAYSKQLGRQRVSRARAVRLVARLITRGRDAYFTEAQS